MSPTKQSASAPSSPPAASGGSNSNNNNSYTRPSNMQATKETLRRIDDKIQAKLDAQIEKNARMAAEIKELEQTQEYMAGMQKLKDELDEEEKRGRELEGKLREMEGLAIRTKKP
ncbi:hypothetical protein B0T20DRAFT_484128 [Sordaria brevicollis]|uniref:Uncharacterized protein n=1 Tax=Sordaria brevicollis TaxID=83679 RepID=A0AAE0NVN6_SORBR|nr:hypothetical protein B0T20DRAFT_484128 [Sordaria brevicollis]